MNDRTPVRSAADRQALHATPLPGGLARCEDGLLRCGFEIGRAEFRPYHDAVFGRPSADDGWIFEKLCIESLAAGLSLMTVLRKRAAFREAFEGFDIERVARFGPSRLERLATRRDLIRHRRKLQAIVHNARRALALADEAGSLAAFFWRFEPPVAARPDRVTDTYLAAHPTSGESRALAAALKHRGWQFVGPTMMYAVMQGTGLVNDHLEGCAFRETCVRARARFVPPTAGLDCSARVHSATSNGEPA